MLYKEKGDNWKVENVIRELSLAGISGGVRVSALAFLINERRARMDEIEKRGETLGPRERFFLRKKR